MAKRCTTRPGGNPAAWKPPTHFVAGFNEFGGGILATAYDEFTAHRCCKVLKKSYSNAKVLLHTPENLQAVHEQVIAFNLVRR